MLTTENKQPKLLAMLILVCGVFLFLNSKESSPVLSMIQAEEAEFNSYKLLYSKSYPASESLLRFQKFKDNLEYIRRINSQKSTVVLGINKFADMDFKEFSELYLMKTSGPEILPALEEIEYLEVDSLPDTVDWVARQRVSYVRDQGKCGSCYAFAATGALESATAIENNVTTPNITYFSVQQLMDCSGGFGNAGCNGGLARLCFDYILKNAGITYEANYPYLAANGTCNTTAQAIINGNMSNYTNVTAYNYLALMDAVYLQPVATSVEANAQWQLYTGGIITNNCGTNLNHAVLITGYNNNSTTAPVPYWNVKNSWGTNWGQQGYIQIGLSSGPGVCGINTRPVYPTI